MANYFEQFLEPEEERKKKKKENFFSQFVGDEVASEIVPEEEEGEGIWESAKDVGKAIGGGVMTGLHQLGRPQSAVAGGLFNIQE